MKKQPALDGNGKFSWDKLLINEQVRELTPHIEDYHRSGKMREDMQAIHTAECQRAAEEQQIILDGWLAQYPNYCQNCNAEGGTTYPGTLYEPPDFVPCKRCVQQGKCPRCSVVGFDEVGPCKVCGYDYDDRKPGIAYCTCPVPDVPFDYDPFMLPEEEE